jgi:hypothetical protein
VKRVKPDLLGCLMGNEKSLRVEVGRENGTKITPGIDEWRLLICDCRSEEPGSIQRLLPKSTSSIDAHRLAATVVVATNQVSGILGRDEFRQPWGFGHRRLPRSIRR